MIRIPRRLAVLNDCCAVRPVCPLFDVTAILELNAFIFRNHLSRADCRIAVGGKGTAQVSLEKFINAVHRPPLPVVKIALASGYDHRVLADLYIHSFRARHQG